MAKLCDLSVANKLILAGNLIGTFGILLTSIGSLLALAEAGRLPQEPLTPTVNINKASTARNYFSE